MHFGAPGYQLERSEELLKKAGIPFIRHFRNVKLKDAPRVRSYHLEVAINNVPRLLHKVEDVSVAIADQRPAR